MTMTESGVGAAVSAGCLHADATLREAKQLLEGSDQEAFVVADHDRPVGVITAVRLRRSAETADQRTVADVMDYEVVPVEHDWDVPRTMRAYEAAGWASLLKRQPCSEVQ